MKKFIYKICKMSEWSSAKKKRKFTGTKKDIEDGFIHFSKKNQVQSTLKKYFLNKDNLILLKIETSKLKKIIWEKSSGGSTFPHLYSYFNTNKIKSVYKISIRKKVYSFKKVLK